MIDDYQATIVIGLVLLAFSSILWGMVCEFRYRKEKEEKETLEEKLEQLEKQHERDLIRKEIEVKANARN